MKYPKENYEIILVNDSSTDNSVAIVQDFLAANPSLKVKLIEQKEVRKAPKKEAIKKAIEAVVPLKDKVALLIDIGGGSTEITLTKNSKVIASKSYQYGTLIKSM